MTDTVPNSHSLGSPRFKTLIIGPDWFQLEIILGGAFRQTDQAALR